MNGVRVLLAGATGLVGAACLTRLCDAADVSQVHALQRRAGEPVYDAKVRVVPTDFERLEELPPFVLAVDAVLCALGTTIKVAGSQAAFRRVDHDYVVALARLAHAAGAQCFGLVSALGADPASRVFYNRVKGETEAAVMALGFRSCVIVRPSLLLGARSEFRLGERLAAPIGPWLPRRWRAIPAARVAQVLVDTTLAATAGITILENEALLDAR